MDCEAAQIDWRRRQWEVHDLRSQEEDLPNGKSRFTSLLTLAVCWWHNQHLHAMFHEITPPAPAAASSIQSQAGEKGAEKEGWRGIVKRWKKKVHRNHMPLTFAFVSLSICFSHSLLSLLSSPFFTFRRNKEADGFSPLFHVSYVLVNGLIGCCESSTRCTHIRVYILSISSLLQ